MRKECSDQPGRTLGYREGFRIYSGFIARPQVVQSWKVMGNGLGIRTSHFGCHVDEGLWCGRKVEARWAVKMLVQITDFFIDSSNTLLNV